MPKSLKSIDLFTPKEVDIWMSGAERVQSFNPILVAIWLTQILLLYLDWQPDSRVSWSIPIIGSFFFIQLYFLWRTNYDDMLEEQREAQAKVLGGPMMPPLIDIMNDDNEKLYSDAKQQKQLDDKDIININEPDNEN